MAGRLNLAKMKNKTGRWGRRRCCRRHRDFISDLPLCIIHIIQSFLPFKEAVRTSILSKQWRFTWVSLPYLKFDDDDQLPGQKDPEFAESENRIISHALRRHEGPILRFEMSFSEEIHFPKLNEWILFLSRNDIRELVIKVGHFLMFNMDESIYNCLKLTHLEVCCVRFGRPPSTFNGFPFLKCLSLQYCDLSDEVKSLLVNFPLLERLTLKDYHTSSELLKINLSYLNYLCLRGIWKEIHLCAPLLTELNAQIHDVCNLSNYTPLLDNMCNYINFLGGCHNLEKICGVKSFTKFLSIGMESCQSTLVFARLKEIELHGVDFRDIKELSVVARLLVGAPNLQKLVLSGNDSTEEEEEDVSIREFGFPPNFTFKKLRVVTMFRICSMKLVKFLLKNSPALQRMVLNNMTDKDYRNVTAKLLNLRRASPNSMISLNEIFI